VSERKLNIVVLGLSITSSWGNGHATTYRSLLRGVSGLGHDVLFLERDQPWYADNRDLPQPDFVRLGLYRDLADLKQRYARAIRDADAVIVGSYVPDGVEVGRYVTRHARGLTAFYDIDTPITLALLASGEETYLSRALIPRYGLYLSFTGGPALELLCKQYGAPQARALYCAADPVLYRPERLSPRWDLGYMGTYSADRQPSVSQLLLQPAAALSEQRFVVAGPQYPDDITWPYNVERIDHLAPDLHRAFYNQQRFTLNVTRAHMRALGYSPSVRLFEAAACGTPIISDSWPGLSSLFEPDAEILIAERPEDCIEYLTQISEDERLRIGAAARARVLASHTGEHRAQQLLRYLHKAQSSEALTTLAET